MLLWISSAWSFTLPVAISGLLGVFLVMGVIVLAVLALGQLTARQDRKQL
ncbi:MAG: oxaloacetate decarboxylase [Faecalibacterium sp.]